MTLPWRAIGDKIIPITSEDTISMIIIEHISLTTVEIGRLHINLCDDLLRNGITSLFADLRAIL